VIGEWAQRLGIVEGKRGRVTQKIKVHRLENGLTLIGEEMPWLESAAFSIAVPAGCQRDPVERLGLANFASDMVQRGCGSRDSRKYIEDLEYLGVDSSSSVSIAHTNFSGAMPAESLLEALSIFTDTLRRPHLPGEQLEDARMVCLQEVLAMEDDLAQKVMIELRNRHYPGPFGRSCQGNDASVAAITLADVESFHETHYHPEQTIVSVAGRFDWDKVVAHVEQLLGDWDTPAAAALQTTDPVGGHKHIEHNSQQTHIALAFASPPYSSDEYLKARAAVGVLSDGMSSRLFTEVREKRGLCYTVYASNHSLTDRGCIICYSGTSADRAQETLDVIWAELNKLAKGIGNDELVRLKTQIKSGLIMQQESSRSRAGSLVGDWYHLGRVRPLGELLSLVDQLTTEEINEYLAANTIKEVNVVTLGQKQLEVPVGV